MVEIARALSIDARVLVLDEPTSSLTDDEVASLFSLVRTLRDEGVGIIFVSHRLQEVFELADRVTVLRDGQTVGEALAVELDRPQLIHLMVGRALEEIEPPRPRSAAVAPSCACGVTLPRSVAAVDLDVERGEIVGLAGLVGAGRSELLETVFGLHRPSAGSIEVDGAQASFRSPREAIRGGIAFVPADRRSRARARDDGA